MGLIGPGPIDMRIRPLLPALLIAAFALPGAGAASDREHPRAPPLRGGECLDPNMARSFTELDDNRLLVDAGHYRYLIEVSSGCWNLRNTPVIGFRATAS